MDADGSIAHVHVVDDDDAVRAALPPALAAVVVDQPLSAATRGRRPTEAVLAWLDHPTMGVTTARYASLFGGLRATRVLPTDGVRAEGIPALAVRQLVWESTHPVDAEALPLEEYRARWAATRAPRYRHGTRRGIDAAALDEAAAVCRSAFDMGGWVPDVADAAGRVESAAILDAMLCAYTARRWQQQPSAAVVLANADGPPLVVPGDANLRQRTAITVARLSGDEADGPPPEAASSTPPGA